MGYKEWDGHMQGTSMEAVELVAETGKVCVLEVDVDGAKNIYEAGFFQEAIFVFLSSTSPEEQETAIRKCLRENGIETEEEVQNYIAHAKNEIDLANKQTFFTLKVAIPEWSRYSTPQEVDDLSRFLQIWYPHLSPIPVNEPVRIINNCSQRSIYAQNENDWMDGVGASDETSGAYPDAVWKLVPLRDGFQLINELSQRRLYAQKDKDLAEEVGASSPDARDSKDSIWNIVPDGSGFRIVNSHSQRSLYAQHGGNWGEGFGAVFPSGSGSFLEELCTSWRIQPEDAYLRQAVPASTMDF